MFPLSGYAALIDLDLSSFFFKNHYRSFFREQTGAGRRHGKVQVDGMSFRWLPDVSSALRDSGNLSDQAHA